MRGRNLKNSKGWKERDLMRSQKLRSKHFETTQIMFSEKKLAVYIEVIIYRTVQIGGESVQVYNKGAWGQESRLVVVAQSLHSLT